MPPLSIPFLSFSLMELAKKKKKEKVAARACASSATTCFFCAVKEEDSSLRSAAIGECFREMPETEDQELVLVLSGLWNIAMAHPNDPEFPSLGIFPCMARLISRGLADRPWLLRHQNIYIPYYAAHIIGSYTINLPPFAAAAVRAGVVPPLLDLLRCKLSWVEQRVAVRALGHLASYDATFDAVAAYEDNVVELAMHVASTCVDVVYAEFVGERRKRVGYHCDLLTRGMGGVEMENRKAEEWASQLQCWSLHLLNCFACKDRSLHIICRPDFLKEVCNMWGGLVNDASPSGVGLLRILCHSKTGRRAIADCREVVESLCNLSRSSDDWQYMGIDCLLLLLKDLDTRPQVMEKAAGYLADLVELADLGERKRVGEAIAEALLQNFRDGKGAAVTKSRRKQQQQKAVEMVWELKVDRAKKEKSMRREEAETRWASAVSIKQAGNERFWGGEVEAAAARYSEALEVCPMRMRKERMVLYSNRAQCWLLLRKAEKAASDATRALCLAAPANSHRKSLWRRSQAYDMMGLPKESLMDCVVFVNGWLGLHDHDHNDGPQQQKKRSGKVPYYAARMISKQMSATWLFAGAHRRRMADHGQKIDGDDEDNEDMMKGRKATNAAASIPGLSTIQEEPMNLKGSVRKLERATSRRRKSQGPIKSCLY